MGKPDIQYERLSRCCREARVPKGYVPLIVGSEEAEEERFVVHVSLLKCPSICSLLELAAQEFGYGQQGILRIPCGVQEFQLIFNELCKAS